ncbi:MAG: trimethylamine methyltransferase family protein [Anaerolineales bacterium]|nr:trimethylamine methyltransferase family protein [Anaerolineales bacterium]
MEPQPTKGLEGGQYQPLTAPQVQQIHDASLRILQQTGVQVENPQALELFKAAGTQVEGKRVRLTPSIIEDAVASAPSEFLLAGRDAKHDLELGGKRVYVGTGGSALQVLDLSTGFVRGATLEDVGLMARIVDALNFIHFYLIPIYPTDLPMETVEVNKFYRALANTTKHVQGGAYSLEGIRDVIEMGEHVAGSPEALRERPLISFITSWVVSPLQFESSVTALLLEVCQNRLPVVLSAAPIAGLTAPVTLAGMLAQSNAEQLAGLTLTQLAQPGAPVLMGPIPATADMYSGKFLAGSVEFGLANAAISQLTQFYQIPNYNSAGLTESKLPDIQAGIEKASSTMQVVLAGSNFIHHAAGMLEDMSTVAYEQLVIDNEMLGMAMRAVQGIEVNEETLAVDIIDSVGPGGHYLLEDHTVEHLRGEHYFPSLVMNRHARDQWEQEGSLDARDRARYIATQILASHDPEPLPAEVESWIRKRFPIV